MDREQALELLGLQQDFSREDVQRAYLESTKRAHKNGSSSDEQQRLNIARDTLNDDLDASQALVPILARELAKLNTGQELSLRRQEARQDLSDSIQIAESKAVNRLHSNRDLAGIFAALSGALGFFRQNIEEITQTVVISPTMSGALLLASATLTVFAFLANRSAKRVSERTKELNRVLTRQRTIERILARAFARSDSLGERQFEEQVIEAIQEETGFGENSRRSEAISILLRPYEQLGLIPQRGIGRGFYDDYIDFLIKSDYVVTHGASGNNLIFQRQKL